MSRRAMVLVTLAGLCPAAASAQTCFRGGPRPACHQFILLEMNASRAGGVPSADAWVLGWSAGLLVNVQSRTAIGGTVILDADNGGHRAGVEGRYRRWLRGRTALDLAPTVYFGNRTSSGGAGLSLALSQGNLIGISFSYQTLGGSSRLYAGIRFGSWMTPVATAGLIGLAAATYN